MRTQKTVFPALLALLAFGGADGPRAAGWVDAPLPVSYRRLTCISMVSPESGWAGGRDGLLLRLYGDRWHREDTTIEGDIVALVFPAVDRGWVLAYNVASQRSTLHELSGTRWTAVPLPIGTRATTMSRDAEGTVFVFAQGGQALRRVGGRWVETVTPGFRTMSSAVGLSDGTVWAVGEFGAVWRWDGSRWHAEQVPAKSYLRAVAATSTGRIWVAGDGGAVILRENGRWRKIASPSSANIHAVSAKADSEVWFGGEEVLLRWNGSRLERVAEHPLGAVTGIDVAGAGNGWAVGLGVAMRLTAESGSGTPKSGKLSFYRQELLPNAVGIYGAAFGDCNGDGRDDLFLVSLRDANHLLVNRGAGGFVDETGALGLMGGVATVPVVREMAQFGAAWGDYDNDGRLDLAVAGWHGSSFLYRQNSSRRFADVTRRLPLREGPLSANSVTFCDVDRDGFLDLFVTNEHGSNMLWENNGRGGWVDATYRWGLVSRGGSKDGAFGDLDNDGDADLFVCNWYGRNSIYRNDSNRFTDVSANCEAAGTNGQHNGVTLADLDNDGDLDVLVTSSDGQNRLWRNDGDWRFSDTTGLIGFASGPFSHGSAAADFDNDGLLDILIVSEEGITYFRNLGGMQFVPEHVDGLTDVKDGRAVAVSDIDNDGDIDVFVASKADFTDGFSDFSQRKSACFFNKLDWRTSIGVRVRGVYSNYMALGSRVELFVEGPDQVPTKLVGMREISVSNGCRSQNSASAHFGADSASRYVVRVTFPSGRQVVRSGVSAGENLSIAEADGIAAAVHGVGRAVWRSLWSDTARRHVFPLFIVIPLLVWALRNASQRLLWGSLLTNAFTVALAVAYALLAMVTVTSSWWAGVLVPALTVSMVAFLVVTFSYWAGPRAADRVAHRRRIAALEARADVTGVLSQSLDTKELAEHALVELSELFPVSSPVLVLCEHGTERIELVVPPEAAIPGLALGRPLPQELAQASSQGTVTWEGDVAVPTQHSGFAPVCIALRARGARVGVIVGSVSRRQLGSAIGSEPAMRSFAAFVGMSLYNAQLQQQARIRDASYREWLQDQGAGESPEKVPSPTVAHRELTRRLAVIRKHPPAELGTFESLTGESAAMQEVRNKLKQVAPTDTSVLLLGPSGTGKELAARALHGQSRRSGGPFVPVNCGAIPEGLLESELFGHTKGAFTGAYAAKSGVFQRAHHGTIFLDEIAEMNPAAQIRLLRVLQERTVTPVGGETAVPVDVRVIAATHQDLGLGVAEGRFREDLYYRLNVFPIHLPTLAERMDDVPLLVASLLYRSSLKTGLPLNGMAEDAVARILTHPWKGNVRELENCLERASLVAGGEVIRAVHVQFDTASANSPVVMRQPDGALSGKKLAEVEQELIETTLKECRYNVSEAARRLGISRDILRYRMKKFDIARDRQRQSG